MLRNLCTHASETLLTPPRYPAAFNFWPDFFSLYEQRILLSAALQKLDSVESRKKIRRRKQFLESRYTENSDPLSIQGLFLPDTFYDFQEGHYDGVIHHFREMHLTSWPGADFPELSAILQRLYSLCPSQDRQTHLLHLSSSGHILPHVDNVDASGSWILGVSLGDTRRLRMEQAKGERLSLNVILPSGSVYLQQDQMRFNYRHSIDPSDYSKTGTYNAQRLSIMIRDRLKLPTK